MMHRLILVLLVALLLSCTSVTQEKALVLPYEAFGPPVVASEVIGMDWWQWQAHGDSKPRRYHIKVVVYQDLDTNELAQSFPVIPTSDQDYRYLEYEAAMAYLNKVIADNVMPELTRQLIETRTKISDYFSL